VLPKALVDVAPGCRSLKDQMDAMGDKAHKKELADAIGKRRREVLDLTQLGRRARQYSLSGSVKDLVAECDKLARIWSTDAKARGKDVTKTLTIGMEIALCRQLVAADYEPEDLINTDQSDEASWLAPQIEMSTSALRRRLRDYRRFLPLDGPTRYCNEESDGSSSGEKAQSDEDLCSSGSSILLSSVDDSGPSDWSEELEMPMDDE